MKTVDQLNQLIKELQGHNDWYWVSYQPRHDYKEAGEVYRGYYLHNRTPGYTSSPGSYNWSEYVNGEHIGSSFNEAQKHIRREIPYLDNGHWYEEYKKTRKELADTMLLLKDFTHYAHSVNMGFSLNDFDDDYRKRSVELFQGYLKKAQGRVAEWWEEDE